jgi:outer membrane biogenesis lipoprotein LolB
MKTTMLYLAAALLAAGVSAQEYQHNTDSNSAQWRRQNEFNNSQSYSGSPGNSADYSYGYPSNQQYGYSGNQQNSYSGNYSGNQQNGRNWSQNQSQQASKTGRKPKKCGN